MQRSKSNYELYSEEGPLKHYNIECKRVYRNAPTAFLYEQALKYEKGTAIMANGAIQTRSGKHTGRSPKDKRIVYTEETKSIWWGDVNIKLEEEGFKINKERAVDYLNTRERLYITDCYAGHDPKQRIKIRLVTARAYHALFLTNMLIKPTKEELENDFDSLDFIIYNAGEFPANRFTTGMTSKASVALNFKTREMIILGTQYAGEMKKGVFTVMHYLMPLKKNLSLHSSCNQSMKDASDVALFFGLSGTGKTTLSTDTHRYLIGDDEHVWTDEGVFNIEGGCYAKCDGLKEENEPDIYRAIRYGAVVENVVYDESTREIDFDDLTITQNTRCAYPLEFIPNAKIPACTTYHPRNIILLTCDAFGVLPPVTKLSSEQAMYHFISGYTAKVAGTEVGVTKPTACFSACFGSPFLVFHPQKYANLLAEKMEKFNCNAYLVNTGWIEGSAESGAKRCPLKYTRMIIDAIHAGKIRDDTTEFEELANFGLSIPKEVEGVPSTLLNPRQLWQDKDAYDDQLKHLASLFKNNFKKFAEGASEETLKAGPN